MKRTSDAAYYDGTMLTFGSNFIKLDQQNTCASCVGVTDFYSGVKIVLDLVSSPFPSRLLGRL